MKGAFQGKEPAVPQSGPPSGRPTPSRPDEDLTRLYLTQIGGYRLLTGEEEVSLAQAIEAGARAAGRLADSRHLVPADTRRGLEASVAQGRRARERFVAANLRLVVAIARRYQGFGLPFLDLVQDGNIGLMRAVEKFDWRLGFKFSTYATWWIRQGITRGLADTSRTIRTPVHVAEAMIQVRAAGEQLVSRLGREPNEDEIAEVLGISAERVLESQRLARSPVSLNAPVTEGDFTELHELLVDDAEGPDMEVERRALSDHLRDLLYTLPPRERRIIEMRFGLADGRPRTLEEIGGELRLTRERIRQIAEKSLGRLRHPALRPAFQELMD